MMATLLPLTGCPSHALIVVNVGIANKTAAGQQAPFDLDAYCAALTRQGYIVKKKGLKHELEISPDDTDRVCRDVWYEQQQAKEKKQ